MSFQRRFVMTTYLRVFGRAAERFDDRLLSLVAADGRLRDFDPHLVGDLELHALVAEARDLSVDAAGRDDAVADLQARRGTPAPSAACASSAAG